MVDGGAAKRVNFPADKKGEARTAFAISLPLLAGGRMEMEKPRYNFHQRYETFDKSA